MSKDVARLSPMLTPWAYLFGSELTGVPLFGRAGNSMHLRASSFLGGWLLGQMSLGAPDS